MKELTLLIITTFCVFGCTDQNKTEKLLAKMENLQVKNDSLSKIIAKEKPELNYWFEMDFVGEKLIENGIENPAEFIEKSLREKPEMIPLKAVLGGTMHFRKIQLVSSEWIIAEFEDGHIQGKAIFKYKLNKKGKLEFEFVDSVGV